MDHLTRKELQAYLKSRGLKATGKTAELRERCGQEEESRPSSSPGDLSNPPKKAPGINWRNSIAKQILIEDLEEGFISLSEEQLSPEEAWDLYRPLLEFKNVPFHQFKKQLKAHREQVSIRKERLGLEEAALIQFRTRNPRKTHNNKYKPVFDMMPGKQLLRGDVKDGLHLVFSLRELHHSRPEYACLTPKKFNERVYQEIKRKKYFHHLKLKSVEWNKRKKDRRSQQKPVPMEFELLDK